MFWLIYAEGGTSVTNWICEYVIVAVDVYSILPTTTRVSAGVKPSPVIVTRVPPAVEPN